MKFVIKGQPSRVTEQQHRFGGYSKNGRAIIFRDKRLQAERERLMFELSKFRPWKPFDGPLALNVWWYFGTADKSKIRQYWKITRPDTDNLLKGLKDCLTQCGYWHDDSQVCSEVLAKAWCSQAEARIEIAIEPLTEMGVE